MAKKGEGDKGKIRDLQTKRQERATLLTDEVIRQYNEARAEMRKTFEEVLGECENVILVGVIDGEVRKIAAMDMSNRHAIIGALTDAVHATICVDTTE